MEEIKQLLESRGLHGIEREDRKRLANKYSTCPNCHHALGGVDILDALIILYPEKIYSELVEIANQFGWTKENELKFTRFILVKLDDKLFYKCPGCNYLYSPLNGFMYRNESDAISNIPMIHSINEYNRVMNDVIDINNIEIEGEKPISDMSDKEIKELLDKLASEYRLSSDPIKRKQIKRDYLELAAWYNRETGTQTFKMSL